MSTNTIHLVMGVSSSGKSSYINAKIANGEWEDIPLLMAYELDDLALENIPDQEFIIHYNLFRPYYNDAKNLENEFLDDSVLSQILKHRDRIDGHLLVVHSAILSKRILLRTVIEENLKQSVVSYPHQQIFEIVSRVEMGEFHNKWLRLLDSYDIDFQVINSETTDYFSLSPKELSSYFQSECRVNYSNQEIEYILENNEFEYQQIKLPGNQPTTGQDRTGSLGLIDQDLSGKSLLDIGCAYGYFCFEAEKRNASKVVGTELKRHRYIGANIVREITGANSEILYRDVFDSPLDETFDIVILLNVIHHLKEPIKALRMAARMCSEKLIIEFPTLSDKKFNSTLNEPVAFDMSLPLIGVSLQEHYDQTFLFSEQAIERILLEHDIFFTKIEFLQSPMNKDRRVAICYK